MKSLFVPVALVESYLASGTDRAVWKDVGLLTSILSPADVAFYIHANVQADQHFGGAMTASFPNLLATVYKADGYGNLDKLVQRALSALSGNSDQSAFNVGPLVTPDVLYIDDQLVVYTLGASEVPAAGMPTDGWYELMSKIHPFFQFHELAALPVFAEYVKHRPSVSAV